MNLLTVKPKAETFGMAELGKLGMSATVCNDMLIKIADVKLQVATNLCFPTWLIIDAIKLDCTVSRPTDLAVTWFCNSVREERIDFSWPIVWLVPSDNGFVPDDKRALRLQELIKKRMSRVAKFATIGYPAVAEPCKGLFIIDASEKEFWVSRTALFFGQRRMRDDREAPSRSFLKIEEAFTIFGRAPGIRETVVDLGAAPGGWSWAAAKRSAQVYAIDNGPLKNGAENHPHIKHIRADAFTWRPSEPVYWLFCDLVENPSQVLKLIRMWFEKQWCRYAIVNFKYGQADPFALLETIRSSKGLAPFTNQLLCRHLFHDREEFTIMADVKQ